MTEAVSKAAKIQHVTTLLLAWSGGDRDALDQLVPLVHEELRRRARRAMFHERADHSLQPTALVNEVYLRLVDMGQVQWNDRAHFLALAARLMRRILVDSRAVATHTEARRGPGEREPRRSLTDIARARSGKLGGPGRRAERACRARPATKSGRGAALLRRAGCRRDCRGPQSVAPHGNARLDVSADVALQGASPVTERSETRLTRGEPNGWALPPCSRQLIEQEPGPRGSPHVPHAPTAGMADVDEPPLVCAAKTDRRRWSSVL